MASLGDIRKVIFFFSVLILVAIIAVLLHAHSLVAAGTSLMWSLACLSSAGAVGFLFGIPKVLQSDLSASAGTPYRQQPNTNLEQISDWLTKIIVGLGLIEIRSIPPFLHRMAEILAGGIGSVEDHIGFASALIPYFLAVGFLVGYLLTRIFLAPAFARADTDSAAAVRDAQDQFATVLDSNRDVDPDLIRQFILNTKPETFIKGGNVDEGTGTDEDEAAKLNQALAKLEGRNNDEQ
jgi:hypothetical protein